MKHLIINGLTNESKEIEIDEQTFAAIRPTPEQIANQLFQETQNLRRAAFTTESDPLYFGWQRGENTEKAWLDKVAEIRARYPYSA